MLAPDSQIRRRARGMVGQDQRTRVHGVHLAQGLQHHGPRIARRVGRPGFADAVGGLQTPQHLALAVMDGDDQGRVLAPGRIQLKTVEEHDARRRRPGALQLGPGEVVVQLRMVRAAVIGRDHPAQTEAGGGGGVLQDRMRPVAAERRRRPAVGGRGIRLIGGAVVAVHVVIAGQPAPRLRGRIRRPGRGCATPAGDEQQGEGDTGRSPANGRGHWGSRKSGRGARRALLFNAAAASPLRAQTNKRATPRDGETPS